MRAVAIAGKKQLSVVETETPKPDGKNVIIKISQVGICGSDLHIWANGDPPGLVMGHEFAGTVADPGALKDTLKVGDRVTALPINPCGECPPCKSGHFNMCAHGLDAAPGITSPGAYAEYFVSRPDMVRKLPDTVSDSEAAMIEPTGVALRAVRLAGVKPGDKVLVTGGGIIGLLCANWAKIAGASYVAMTEINQLRSDNALKMGDVDKVFDGKDEKLVPKLIQASGGGFDQALECTAIAAAVNNSIMSLKSGGKLMIVGVNFSLVPVSTLWILLHELEVKGTIAYTEEFDISLDLMSKKLIATQRFVSATVGLDGVQGAFERLTSGTNSDVKILIKPQVA